MKLYICPRKLIVILSINILWIARYNQLFQIAILFPCFLLVISILTYCKIQSNFSKLKNLHERAKERIANLKNLIVSCNNISSSFSVLSKEASFCVNKLLSRSVISLSKGSSYLMVFSCY